MRELWADIEALDDQAPTELQYDMMYETTRLLRHLSYWVLRNHGDDLDIERAGSRLESGIRELMRDLPELIEGTEVERYERSLARFSREGVPPKLSRRVASLGGSLLWMAIGIAGAVLTILPGSWTYMAIRKRSE